MQFYKNKKLILLTLENHMDMQTLGQISRLRHLCSYLETSEWSMLLRQENAVQQLHRSTGTSASHCP